MTDERNRNNEDLWIIHLYRGLVQTNNMWRQRMDATADWATGLILALGTFTFGPVPITHGLLLVVGIAVIVSAVLIEARRYRILHHTLWRTYLIEVGAFASILANVRVDDLDWRSALARDLVQPRATIGLSTAILARMRRTYLVLLYLLVVVWLFKVVIHPTSATSIADVLDRLQFGALSGSWFLVLVVAMLALATISTAISPSAEKLENWAATPLFRDAAHALGAGPREGSSRSAGTPPRTDVRT